ncbi:MAG: aspartyl-phosphate phosphatase Spo0E family protein [Bacillota bacterium]
MTLPQKKMLSRIQILREQLNKQVDGDYNIRLNSRTLELSRELDKLIYRYMKKYLQSP